MDIKGKVVYVTGANRGLGLAFVKALIEGGARKVYAASRNGANIVSGSTPVTLDVTDAAAISALADKYADVDIVINNAGIISPGNMTDEDAVDKIRQHLDVNVYGLLNISKAFAPVLKANGGGALINILSVLSWLSLPGTGAYSASKATAWAITNGLRQELRSQGTLVVGVHPAYIDTDMTAAIDAPKSSPEDVVKKVLEGIKLNHEEILVDELGSQIKESLSTSKPVYLN